MQSSVNSKRLRCYAIISRELMLKQGARCQWIPEKEWDTKFSAVSLSQNILANIRLFEYYGCMPDLDALRRFKADIFQALAHPTRISMVEALREGELSAGKLIQLLELEQANA